MAAAVAAEAGLKVMGDAAVVTVAEALAAGVVVAMAREMAVGRRKVVDAETGLEERAQEDGAVGAVVEQEAAWKASAVRHGTAGTEASQVMVRHASPTQ